MDEGSQEVLVMALQREQGGWAGEREQCVRAVLELLYPPFFMQDDRLINPLAMFSSGVSEV